MAVKALPIGVQRKHCTMSDHRGFNREVRMVHCIVALLFTLFCVVNSGPCATNVLQNPVKYDSCGPYKENFKEDCVDEFAADVNTKILPGNSMAHLRLENVCTDSNLFCFPSTLPGSFYEEKFAPKNSKVHFDDMLSVPSTQGKSNLSWASNYDNYKLLSGKAVSCSMNLQESAHDMSCHQTNSYNQDEIGSCRGTLLERRAPGNEKSVKIKSGISDGSSLHVEISPPLLEWGQKYLYFPSLAFVTVMNTHNDSNLDVYEPYSTSRQFYPCNFSEMTLGPGEVASICFVFLPTKLGLSSAHLILQTSFGGFLIHARGFADESPYGIQSLFDLDKSFNGRLRKNISLYNPFDETLYVEEVTAQMYFSSGSVSHLAKSICSLNSLEDDNEFSNPSVQKWFRKKVAPVDLPGMAMRPHGKWEVGSHSNESIIELDLHYSQGKIFGAFCMQVLRSSVGKADIIVIPLEADSGMILTSNVLTNPISVSLGALLPCADSGTVLVALSLRNTAPYMLKVIKISSTGESTQHFRLKYVEGLIIFPGSATQVASVAYSHIASQLHGPPPESPNLSVNCKVLILTNDTSNPLIEVPCHEIVSICSRNKFDSYVGYEHGSEDVDNSARSGYMETGIQPLSEIKASEMAQADEMVLGNWRSQGTASGMSVLDEHEMLFPMVEIGTYHSKWITVKNPSHQPVVMQLILNSGEIVDECRDANGLLQPSSSSSLFRNKNFAPTRYGFSIADSAVTEAFVHPFGKAIFGPILFHPSSRCWWTSSALVRNNLSGVEWLSLRGFGGSLSLALFEGSDSVQTIEFKFNVPQSLNVSPSEMLHYRQNHSNACYQPSLKELYAKNTGDLPVEVKKIEISGAQCHLDGFLVHTCKGFILQPGESMKLMVSYQTDFSAVMVQRDLQLTLATGILVIPMKASLPIPMLNLCKQSVLWVKLKKTWVPFVFGTSVMFLLFYCTLPLVIYFDYLFRSGKFSLAAISNQGKSSRGVLCNQKNCGKLAMSPNTNEFSGTNGKHKLISESGGRCPDGQCIAPEVVATAEAVNLTWSCRSQNSFLLDSPKETMLPPSLLSKVATVETSALQEAPEHGKLTIKVGKEKGKRRRKKKGSGAGLAGQLEVSSSQSGNSTPSSPLSPVTLFTPKRSCSSCLDVDPHLEARHPFNFISDVRRGKTSGPEMGPTTNFLEPMVPVKYGTNSLSYPTEEKPTMRRHKVTPVLLSSATFPSTSRSSPNMMNCTSPPLLPSTSPIAPHARAPGSRLGDGTTVERREKTGNEDDFKYDIWGDHLFGMHLTGRSGEIHTKSRFAAKYDSDSFFLRGPQPQILVPNNKLTCVGSHQEG